MIKITTAPTFTATIYVGFKDRATGNLTSSDDAVRWIQEYVDSVGLCVSVTDTRFIYTDGAEDGLAVGLINYPRFPSSPEKIKAHSIAIAKMLLRRCKQSRVSIVMPQETLMLSSEDASALDDKAEEESEATA